jgi:hypothetical protein
MVELIKRELYIDAGQKRDRGPAESPIEGFSVFNHGLCCGWLPVKKKKKVVDRFPPLRYRLIKKNRIKKEENKNGMWSFYVRDREGRKDRRRQFEWEMLHFSKKKLTFVGDVLENEQCQDGPRRHFQPPTFFSISTLV